MDKDIPAGTMMDRWKFAIDASGDAVWDWNLVTGDLEFSEAMRSILGCDIKVIPRSIDAWLQWVHPDDRPQVDQDIQRLIDGRTPIYMNEHRLIQADGTIRWVLDRGKIIDRDPSGKPLRVIGIYSDITRLKEAENQIQLQSLVLDQIADCVTVTDMRGNVKYINKAVERMLGRDRSQFIGKPVDAYGDDPAHGATQKEIINTTLQNGEWRGEVVNIDVRGGQALLDCRTRIVKDNAGKPVAMCGISTDITERRKTEELLKLSEKKYRLLFDTLLDGFAYHEIIRDSNGKPVDYRFLDINPAFTRLTGLPPSQILGKTVLEVMPDIEKEWIDTYGRVADTGIPEVFERFIKNLNRWYRVATYQPEKERFVCVFQDVTDQKYMQESLRKREEEYRLIVETSIEGIWVMDESLHSTYINRRMSKIFGYEYDEMIRTPFYNYIFPEDVPSMKAHLQKRHNGETEVYEHRFRRKNGSECWCLVSAVPIMKDGRFQGSFAMFTDITDKKIMEAYFRQSQKMEAVGRLAAGVAHDFNNQLTIIQGYCDRLLRDIPDGHPLHDSLVQIRKASQRSQATTRHLLAYSRKQMLRPEQVDIGEFLREIKPPIANLIGEDIIFELLAPEQTLMTLLDRSELHQAVMNLAVNARDAMPDGGRLVLRASRVEYSPENPPAFPEARHGSFILLQIIDSGVGMDAQTLDHAYEPFFTTKEVGKGTGMGLPMVQGFVSQSQGFMRIVSQKGKGTSVDLYFPETAIAEAHSSPAEDDVPHPTPASHSRGTLLVVEDEESVRKLIVWTLKEQGYDILAASSPSEALKIARDNLNTIDLLISDMVMPEMKGIELAARVRSLIPGLQTLYITGYSPDQAQADSEILPKPFRAAQLIDAVKRGLGNKVTS